MVNSILTCHLIEKEVRRKTRTKIVAIFVTFSFLLIIGFPCEVFSNESEKSPRPKEEQDTILQVTITTDKPCYYRGQTMRIEINNQSEQKTYTWIGSCSLTLEYHTGNAWEACPTPWSGCSLCGHAREIPHPIFLGSGATEEIEWDLIVTWCDEGTIKTGPALGRFRFAFRYTEDEPGCRSSLDPFQCWLRYQDKKWQSAYSNEFTVSE